MAGPLSLVAVVVGCSSPDSGWQGLTGIEHSSTTAAAAGATPVTHQPIWVDVLLGESKLDMPLSMQPGPTVLVVTNQSATERTFSIEGSGITQRAAVTVRPGEVASIAVNLTPGIYIVSYSLDVPAASSLVMEVAVVDAS